MPSQLWRLQISSESVLSVQISPASSCQSGYPAASTHALLSSLLDPRSDGMQINRCSWLPSQPVYFFWCFQAKVMNHRKALLSKGRPRIKGRFGRKAEQLRDWLGEYLIARYDRMVQVDTNQKTTFRLAAVPVSGYTHRSAVCQVYVLCFRLLSLTTHLT